MKKIFAFLSALCATYFVSPAIASAQSPGPAIAAPTAHPYWQQQVNYSIDVTLNDSDRTLDGFIRMDYINHSPDTLSYIWIHCWPNAYKNDRTAFSEQLIGNGRTDFYFSDRDQRGYIDRLDFRADGQETKMEDHPLYIDIIKVVLPHPLLPGEHVILTSPFHEKLPFNFSRGGYTTVTKIISRKQGVVKKKVTTSYQLTQWYPKPAVYDRKGWHPIPYLDQGEFYSEYGDFDVHITVPTRLTVAATGQRQDSSLQSKTKTLHYKESKIHDFAWFAAPDFITRHDTLQLASGRVIDVYSYYTPASAPYWKNSIRYIKDAVKFRSALIGEYPYSIVSAVQAGSAGGMEYPTITSIGTTPGAKDLDVTIEHEVGHNWFYGILGTNERRYPWMDEGINTYYDQRYSAMKYPPQPKNSIQKKIPDDLSQIQLDAAAAQKTDQPISTSSENFTADNYDLIAYFKTGYWMQKLEHQLGTPLFDSCMRQYYRQWAFQHPYPEDIKAVFETTTHQSLDTSFALLDKKGPLTPPPHKKLRPAFLFDLRNTDKYNYINILPAAAYNEYDRLMIGLLIHNYSLAPSAFHFYAAPIYATGSHQLNGGAGANYSWYPDHSFQKIDLGVSASKFATMDGTDSSGKHITGSYFKIVPTLKLTFPKAYPRDTREGSIEWKTFLIGERSLDSYVMKTSDSLYYPTEGKYKFRYINQLSLSYRDTRVLYPCSARLEFQQADEWYRINFNGNYFFNYEKGGGLSVRVFGAKFGYLGARSATEDLSRYEPKLTAVRGSEDYTYSNYFLGRNEYTGIASQQIMMRDGDLKLRTDLFQELQGRSDDWVASLNLVSTLPQPFFPAWVPLKLFFDIGTYSGAWQTNPPTSHFLYTGGIELSLLHDIFHIYAPLIYSSDFRNQLRTVPDQNSFGHRLSFSIDIQNFEFKKILGAPSN